MLVGRRRRFLNYLQRQGPRRLPRAHQRARPAPLSEPCVAPGTPAPEFTLTREDGEHFTQRRPRRADDGPRLLPVRVQPGLHRPAQRSTRRCSTEFARAGRDALRRLVRPAWAQRAFTREARRHDRAALGLRAQGRDVQAFGVYFEPGGMPTPRARDDRPRRRRAAGASRASTPACCRARTSIFDGLAAAAPERQDLGSAPVPPLGARRPRPRLRRRSAAARRLRRLRVPVLRRLHLRLREQARARWTFRHFPVRSKHPRAWAAACAAEAAGLQGAFGRCTTRSTPTRDASRTRTCGSARRALGLDVERFDADRRSEPVVARVRRDFESGVRAGVVTTPTVFEHGDATAGRPTRDLQRDRYD